VVKNITPGHFGFFGGRQVSCKSVTDRVRGRYLLLTEHVGQESVLCVYVWYPCLSATWYLFGLAVQYLVWIWTLTCSSHFENVITVVAENLLTCSLSHIYTSMSEECSISDQVISNFLLW